MTPDWLRPMPWLNMEQGERLPSTGEGIINAAGTLGGAFLNRKRDPKAPGVAMPEVNPQVTEPGIPDAEAPEYGARPTEFRASNAESPLLQRRSEILKFMGGGAGGQW